MSAALTIEEANK